jgi:ABC-type transport system involved in multi-copper enzyme maturation permease subunit
MPIHDQSYRRYGGEREDLQRVWFVIARAGMMTFLKKRTFLGLLMFAWLPFIVRAVQAYFSTTFQQVSMLALTADSYRSFLEQQNAFVFFVTVYVGAGLIANDRRANALQIYLSKPLTRGEYILGKFAILFTFLLLVTFFPAMLLLLLQGLFAGSFEFVRKNLHLIPAITLFSLVQVLVASLSMLALSAMSNSSRFVAIMYAGIVLFSDAMFAALRGILGSSSMSWLSVPATLAQIGDFVFRLKLRYETPVGVSFIVVFALVAVSVSVLERKVRGVEVVT